MAPQLADRILTACLFLAILAIASVILALPISTWGPPGCAVVFYADLPGWCPAPKGAP